MVDYKYPATQPGWVPKLVATDLDGTFVCHEHGLSGPHRHARDWLQARGIPVVPVTGRGPRLLELTRSDVGEGGLLIMGQGGVIFDGRTLIHRDYMDGSLARGILDQLRAELPGIRVGAEDGTDFSLPLKLEAGFRWPYTLDASVEVPYDEVLSHEVLKIFVESSDYDIDELLDRVAAIVPSDLANVTHSGIGFVEISPPNVSKAAGVKFICQRFGIDHADVLCFGDMPNDLPMFEWSGRAVAMANAHPDVLAASDDVTDTACDFGIATYLRRLFPDMPRWAAEGGTE